MISLQEIFNAVIQSGLYKKHTIMCPALKEAFEKGIINQFEHDFAKQRIKEYLKAYGSLGGMLLNNKMPFSHEDRLTIYLDWHNRPEFD